MEEFSNITRVGFPTKEKYAIDIEHVTRLMKVFAKIEAVSELPHIFRVWLKTCKGIYMDLRGWGVDDENKVNELYEHMVAIEQLKL